MRPACFLYCVIFYVVVLVFILRRRFRCLCAAVFCAVLWRFYVVVRTVFIFFLIFNCFPQFFCNNKKTIVKTCAVWYNIFIKLRDKCIYT